MLRRGTRVNPSIGVPNARLAGPSLKKPRPMLPILQFVALTRGALCLASGFFQADTRIRARPAPAPKGRQASREAYGKSRQTAWSSASPTKKQMRTETTNLAHEGIISSLGVLARRNVLQKSVSEVMAQRSAVAHPVGNKTAGSTASRGRELSSRW